MTSNSEIVNIVDGRDVFVKTASRDEMRKYGLLHRVTYLLVFSRAGELLVQTRTREKDWYPGYLDLAAGGVLTEEEDYEQSAQRELFEELGIEAPLTYEFKMYFEDNNGPMPGKSWGCVYSCVSDGPFALQKEEVAEVRMMPIKDVLSIPPEKITPDTRLALMAYLMGGSYRSD